MYTSPLKISRNHVLLLSLSLFLLKATTAQVLSDAQIELVKQRLQQGATHSWELGTRAQALLELSSPEFSVLTPPSKPSLPFPPSPTSLNASQNASLVDVLIIARSAISSSSSSNDDDVGGGEPLLGGNGSAGDPASVGVAVLIANWTQQPQQQQDNEDYAMAATAQVEYLLGPKVPKTIDGAISHRVNQLQLWSDFVYMVPPFLAYYGVTTGNQSMMQEAYDQIRLYRNYLSDPSANGLWRHIVLGSSGTDPGHWSTGNGWAAAGMLRVLGTLINSSSSSAFRSQISDLENWVAEIHRAMYPNLQSNGLFKNYVNVNGNSTTNGNFDDASSSALLASTVYRLSLLTGKKSPYISQAERTRLALFSSTSTSTSTMVFSNTPHFTSDGLLTPVVDPDNISKKGTESPEGEAFVLMLYAAWRDWVEVVGNRTGSSSGTSSSNGGGEANDATRAMPRVVVGGVVVGWWLAIIMALAFS